MCNQCVHSYNLFIATIYATYALYHSTCIHIKHALTKRAPSDAAAAATYTHMHTYIYKYTHAYIHAYIPTYGDAYIHTYIHIYIYTKHRYSMLD